jgi:hypothetical protein
MDVAPYRVIPQNRSICSSFLSQAVKFELSSQNFLRFHRRLLSDVACARTADVNSVIAQHKI